MMALLADKSADVNSNLVQGTNSQSLRFTMPGGVAMKVLSVAATINNGAAAAVTPELTIRDQSGVVIATKRQGSTIPAGDTGVATFALRLSAEGGGSTPSFLTEWEGVLGPGDSVATATNTPLSWAHLSGATLLDYTTPSAPTVTTAGIYAFTVAIDCTDGAQAGKIHDIALTVQNAVIDPAVPNRGAFLRGLSLVPAQAGAIPKNTLAATEICLAGAALNALVVHNVGVNKTFRPNGFVQRLS